MIVCILCADTHLLHFGTAVLVDLLASAGDADGRLLDVQWRTDHLATLGVVEIPRAEYLARLATALVLPPALGGSGPMAVSRAAPEPR